MNEDFRKDVPAPLESVPFSIPRPFETELSNGLKIVIVEDQRYPIISFRLAFRTGDINDPDDAVGLTSAVASMLNEGTEQHTSKELAEEIGRLGASVSASAGFDNTIISASTLSVFRTKIIGLLAELVLSPLFPENELSLYKQNAIEGLKFQRSQPDFLADEQVARIIYGSHPYGKYSPSAEDLEKITRDQLVEIHNRNFVPNNATLIIVGDFDRKDLLNEIDARFADWKRGKIAEIEFPELPSRSGRTLTIVDRQGSTQSNIVLANLAVNREHPDYFNLLVMNQVLGAGASSRLFMNLREEKGYTYGAYSRNSFKRHAGSFEATSEVRTAVTGDSLNEFFYELNRIRDEQAQEQELADAQNFITGVFPIRAETQGGLTSLIVSQKLYDLPEDYLETYRDKVKAVTLEDVKRVANQYISPDKMAIVIVGDADEVILQARSFTENIEVYSTDGDLQDISKYLNDSSAKTADISGEWELIVDFQGQKLPISLTLVQNGKSVSGKLESMLAEGEIDNGKMTGNKFSAIVITEFQGQEMELGIKGVIDGDSIEGTMSTDMIPIPLEFSGNRK